MTDPNVEAALTALMRRGKVKGPWADGMVREFEVACSEFLGQFGDTILAALRSRGSTDTRLTEALEVSGGELADYFRDRSTHITVVKVIEAYDALKAGR